MGIAIDRQKFDTIVTCDVCGHQEKTGFGNGVVPDSWMTGHLWLDISLAEQKQIPLCFCATCREHIVESWAITLVK